MNNSSAFRLYLNNEATDEETQNDFGDIRVDQAIGMASEAELHLEIAADEEGRWSQVEEAFAQPFSRVRVEVKIGEEGDYIAIIDGQIVAQRFEFSADPCESKIILIVQDDSVLLNREEKVVLHENMTASDIAQALFAEAGLTPEVDTTAAAGAPLERVIVQRGTNMQLLRELARHHGMFVYVMPGDAPGTSVGHFVRPSLDGDTEVPTMQLMGEERNISNFSANFDAQRPLAASAAGVSITDKSTFSIETAANDVSGLGDESVHDFIDPLPSAMLARTREEFNDADSATLAAVNLSSFAYAASVEVAAGAYDGVLTPYQTVTVRGVGGYLSGKWLISRVVHTINRGSYKQQVNLRRNARSPGSESGGGLPGGVF